MKKLRLVARAAFSVQGLLTLALTSSLALFQNCAEDLGGGGASAEAVQKLQMTSNPTVPAGQSLQVEVTGGQKPYNYSVSNCDSSIDSNGNFTAAIDPSTCTISVQDASNQTSTVTVTVEQVIFVTYSPDPAQASTSITFTATGGSGSYSYSLISGAGTLNGDVYAAPASAEVADFRVTDTDQNVSEFYVVIGAPPAPATEVLYLFMFYNTHVYSNNTDPYPGATLVGPTTFKLYATPSAGTTAVYRCNTSLTHYMTITNCGSYTNEGVFGYIPTVQASGSIPLYQVVKGSDYILTTDPSSESGYTIQLTLGYLPAALQ